MGVCCFPRFGDAVPAAPSSRERFWLLTPWSGSAPGKPQLPPGTTQHPWGLLPRSTVQQP